MYMYEHHEQSVKNMTAHFINDPEILGLYLVGSVATQTERPDSDIDGVAILSPEAFQRKRETTGTLEVIYGKCTYEGGYFDIHYHTREDLIRFAESGSEPMRNLFSCAQPLIVRETHPDLPALVEKVPLFPKEDAEKRRFKFYCTFKQFHGYFWRACKPEGFMRHHVANGMVFNLYRLILIENEILFPSMRKLEESVRLSPNKPDGIVSLCNRFMQTLTDEDCAALVDRYEAWTAYDYPKDWNVVMNHFQNPLEWQ
jgi:predicted nucleotidyltransferase